MAVLPTSALCLDLTISISSFTSYPSLTSSDGGGVIRDLDINQVPSGGEEERITAGMEDEDKTKNCGHPHKKLRLTKEQSHFLEESFKQNQTLIPKQKEALAMQVKLKPRQVEVWFQNRRARSKLKQTEMECEYLKRWFGSLTEQNRRLQKEAEELRPIKVRPTMTMCPCCKRVTNPTTLNEGGPPPKPPPWHLKCLYFTPDILR
ncbi:hypothetical protein F0562_032611 [Nyssa sinensis]|uniref:Homeobox domain-containing protein n=1 Tax=Nyssa sinensis TaxID=561372 RepID=A0A5J5ANJ2_9ASTE|nr:hypothetical protein F0562_032611 [Nyssa sinensis]